MAFGLYKPGQGYWVRVLTATMSGLLILAASAWLWQQLEAVSIPRPTWVLPLTAAEGTGAVGQAVTLQEIDDNDGAARTIGTAVINEVRGEGAPTEVVVGSIAMSPGREPSQTERLAPAAGGATLNAQVQAPFGIPLVEVMYIQAAAVGVLIAGGCVLVYWLVGVRPSTSEFLIATDGEMKKVNWSTRKDVIGSTWVVIAWSVILSGGLWVVDLVFSKFFQLIGVLHGG